MIVGKLSSRFIDLNLGSTQTCSSFLDLPRWGGTGLITARRPKIFGMLQEG
jgi:hypothetical protein